MKINKCPNCGCQSFIGKLNTNVLAKFKKYGKIRIKKVVFWTSEFEAIVKCKHCGCQYNFKEETDKCQ